MGSMTVKVSEEMESAKSSYAIFYDLVAIIIGLAIALYIRRRKGSLSAMQEVKP